MTVDLLEDLLGTAQIRHKNFGDEPRSESVSTDLCVF
jgi:hypothetical protein